MEGAMPGLLASLRRPLPSLLIFAAAISFTTWVGCGSDDNNPMNAGGPSTSSFTGWMGNGTESGKLSLTVHTGNLASRLHAPGVAPHVVTASGFFTPVGGATDTLSGTFDDESGYVDVQGNDYTLSGVYDSGPPSVLIGTYTGPNGNGQFSCSVGGGTSADIYCGTFVNEATTSNGTFVVAIRGTMLEGAAIENGGTGPTGFTGTVVGPGPVQTLNISSTITNNFKLTATGTLDTRTHVMSGTYHIDNYTIPNSPAPFDSGSWTGELQ
jgi:hypothetical protein